MVEWLTQSEISHCGLSDELGVWGSLKQVAFALSDLGAFHKTMAVQNAPFTLF